MRGAYSIFLLAALGGCAEQTRYPSLALRPIEQISLAEPVPRTSAPATSAAIADARYVSIVRKARAGDAAFRARLDAARPVLRAGRSAAVGSDAWSAAQQALSRLQDARTSVVEAMTTLQTATEAPDAQADRGLADAAVRALGSVRLIDRNEADALSEVTPREP